MIITKIQSEDVSKILELATRFHQETYINKDKLNLNKVMRILRESHLRPDKFFLAYSKNDEGDVEGIIAGAIVEHLFADTSLAQDAGLYTIPEKRGSSLGPRLIKEFEGWAKQHNADYTVIYHNTGINTEKSIPFFQRLGYLLRGHIFVKENK